MRDDDRVTAGRDPAPGQHGPSRRSVLRSAAGVGVAGLAASSVVGLAAGPAVAEGGRPSSAGTREGAAARHDPVVVHVRDAATGELDFFHGTSHTRLRDRELAKRLIQGIR